MRYNYYGPYLHNIEEVIVDLGLISKLELDLIEIGEGVLNLQPLEGWRLGGWRPCWGRLLLLGLLTDPTERGGGGGSDILSSPKSHGAMRLCNLLHIDVPSRALVDLHVVDKRGALGGHGHSDGGGGGGDGLWEGGVLHSDRGLRQADALLLRELLVYDGAGLSGVRGSRGDGRALPVDDRAVGEHSREGAGGGDHKAWSGHCYTSLGREMVSCVPAIIQFSSKSGAIQKKS